MTGGFSYAGQTCISVQRILVERPAFTKFRDLLIAGVSKLKVGDPMDDTTDLGPLIRESDAIRATQWVQEAVQDGATLLCGGKRRGSVMEPTVLTGTRPDMKVNCQEIFGPVVTLEGYDDFAQALRLKNIEAWVYHDRFESIVTVGSFDNAQDPRIAEFCMESSPCCSKSRSVRLSAGSMKFNSRMPQFAGSINGTT